MTDQRSKVHPMSSLASPDDTCGSVDDIDDPRPTPEIYCGQPPTHRFTINDTQFQLCDNHAKWAKHVYTDIELTSL